MRFKGSFSLIVLIALFLNTFLVGCARYNFISIKNNIEIQKSKGHYIDGLSFVKQKRHWCGPAALATVLEFWQDDISQEEIAESIYLPNIKGTLTFDLENYAFNEGYFAQSLQSDIYDLGEKIKSDIPVIVMHQVLPLFKRYHYLVVFGYDDTNEVILAYTGKEEPEILSYFNFMWKWKGADYWMLVVCPPEKVDWTLGTYYSNRLGLLYEKRNNLESAQKNYKNAFDLEPTNTTYIYNLANIYLKGKEYQHAITYYKKAISLDEQFADAYNNLACCLIEINQDLDLAKEYLKKAIELNPSHKAYYLDTLGMIYLKEGLSDKAILNFSEALKLTEPSQKDVLLKINEHLDQAYKFNIK